MGQSVNAQVSFSRGVGGQTSSGFIGGALTHDGGYVVGGSESTPGNTASNDVYLYKLDVFGNLEWSKRYGGSSGDIIREVRATPDGGFVLAGHSQSFGSGGWNFILMKVDSLGTLEWANTYGGANLDYCWDVQITSDSGYVMSGHTKSWNSSQWDGYVVRIEQDGTMLWDLAFGIPNSNDYIKQTIETSDGGFVMVGHTSGNSHLLALKTDAMGNVTWSKLMDHADWQETQQFDGVVETFDGNYLCVGYRDRIGTAGRNPLAVELSPTGNINWATYYDGLGGSNRAYAVRQLPDTTYLLAGDIYVPGISWPGNGIVHIDKIGDTLGVRSYTHGLGDYNENMELTPDGGMAFFGRTYALTAYSSNAGVMKVDAAGNPGCIRYDLSANPVDYVLNSTSFGNTYTGGIQQVASMNTPNHTPAYDSIACFNCELPQAGFSFVDSTNVVAFSEASEWADSWHWDFGDGTTSTEQNPVHTFGADSTYQVCLVATNICGSDTICDSVTIVCPLPQVGFTWSSAQYTLSVADTTSNSIASHWNFAGFGTDSTSSSQWIFQQSGDYEICLTSTNACGSDSICDTVTINCPLPAAAFSASDSLLWATFTSMSTGATSLAWNWGAGPADTTAVASYQFPAAGSYPVCLVATNTCGSDTVCDTIAISCPLPVAGFTWTDSLVWVDLTSTASNADSVWWSVGGGTTDATATITHQFAGAGSYQVCFMATNSCGTDTMCDSITVQCPQPIAGFAVTDNLLSVNLSDSALNADSTFWSTGDGFTTSGTLISHLYSTAGTYTICQQAYSVCGADTVCSTVTVDCPLPQTSFFANDSLFGAEFTNTTVNATAYVWDFGDGTTTTDMHPAPHGYAANGDYLVCLTAINSCGSQQYCDTVFIDCPLPEAQFTVTDTLYNAQFTSTLTNATSWMWQFDDGQTSTQANPLHTYLFPGSYSPCLIATNVCGSDTACTDIDISCPPPIAAFSFTNDGLTYAFVDASNAADSLHWDFGDGATSAEVMPVHTYADGQFSVCLTAINACGNNTACSDITAVGLAEPRGETQWQLFPNPANETVTVSGPPTTFRVVATGGRVVLEGRSSQNTTVDVSKLAPGNYWLHIGSRQQAALPLVIQR